jgi:hypothetical protein
VQVATLFRLARSRSAVATCTAFTVCFAHADSTRVGLDVEYLYDDNATRGPSSADERSDNVISVEGHAARSVLLGTKSGLVARAGLRLAEHLTFGDLSQVAFEARGVYRVQPRQGYTQPWCELAASVQWLKHQDSNLRDGFMASATLGVGSHVTDRIRLAANGSFDKRAATGGSVYDLTQSRLWATLNYRVGTSAGLYTSIARVDGDHVFNAISSQGQAWLAPYYQASAPDPALAEEFGGIAPAAYRLDATTVLYELGVNIPLGGNQAIDVNASYFDGQADQGPGTYDGTQIRVAYFYRFR